MYLAKSLKIKGRLTKQTQIFVFDELRSVIRRRETAVEFAKDY